jgi:hypothetical protein
MTKMTHRADYFGVMAGTAKCWSCKQATPVAAIVLDEWEELPEEDEDDIQEGDSPAMLTYIEVLNAEALASYRHAAPQVELLASGTAGQSYWGNACTHCHVLQGDWYLHDSDGPFFPQTPEQEAALTLTWHAVPLEASARYSQAWWLDKFVARHPRSSQE